MKILKYIFSVILLSGFIFLYNSCNYLLHVSKGQINLITSRIPIEKALESPELTKEQKDKLRLVKEIKSFIQDELHLKIDEDAYSTYVQLDSPYVTYLLRVALAYELEAYEWKFPITGSTPYKGFFKEELAVEERNTFPKDQYDTYIRGVTAYSTLGWFEDSVLSSMLAYSESDFITTIFHELTHTILFFKNKINFNERFAEFLGRKMSILFYLKKEGLHSETVQKMETAWIDQVLFSSFMVDEYQKLKQWYLDNKGLVTSELKEKRLRSIQDRFVKTVQLQLKLYKYSHFEKLKLNNAKLLSYRSYNYNMEEFVKLFNSSIINQDIVAFIKYFSDRKNEDPEEVLTKAISAL